MAGPVVPVSLTGKELGLLEELLAADGGLISAETLLEREGLDVEWDGTIGRRLYVKGFRWQRRSPR